MEASYSSRIRKYERNIEIKYQLSLRQTSKTNTIMVKITPNTVIVKIEGEHDERLANKLGLRKIFRRSIKE